MKVAFDIYTDTEFLLEQIDTCNKNPEKSATAKIDKHTTCGYSRFIYCSVDSTKKHTIIIQKI